MGVIKDMLTKAAIKLLRITPAQDKTITISESLTHVGNVTKNRLWYRGDPSELDQFFKATTGNDLVAKSRFWAATPSENSNIRKFHSGLPSMIVDRLSDIIVGDVDAIELTDDNSNELWEKISNDNHFDELFTDAITETLITGDGAFKISIDTNLTHYPIIEFYGGERVDYRFERGRLREVLFYTVYHQGTKQYTLEETYGKGYITYKLFHDEKEVPLNFIEETSQLQDASYTPAFIMAVPMRFFKSAKFKNRGKSIFDTKSDAFDALDEVISQWMDAFRDGRVNKYIPDILLPRNRDTGEIIPPNPFDNRYISTGADASENAKNEIKVTQADINYQAFIESYGKNLDLCLQGIISPSTLGIDLKKTDNAESQREKEKTTLYTRGKIIKVLTEVVPELIIITLKTNDCINEKSISEYEATIKFGEYASPDFDSTVDTVGKAKQYGVMSIEKSIDELYGDTLTDEEKAIEITRIKEQTGIATMEEPAMNIDSLDEDAQNDDKLSTLNGAQISSLMNVIKMVKEGSVTRSEAISIITSTLGISRENAESFIEDGMQNTNIAKKV